MTAPERATRKRRALTLVLSAALLVTVIAGCSTAEPSGTQDPSELDAAIATANTAVANASTYIFSIEQALPGAPSNDDLERLQSTLNAAATQTGAAQVQTAQSALDQFEQGIATVSEAYGQAPAGSDQQQQLGELLQILEVGQAALESALPQ